MTETMGFTDESEAAVLTSEACGEGGDSSAQVPWGGEQVCRGRWNLVIRRERQGHSLMKGFGAECVLWCCKTNAGNLSERLRNLSENCFLEIENKNMWPNTSL